MKMRVILRSGAVIDVDVTEFTVGQNVITGGLDELKWKFNEDENIKLKYVRVEEVAAVLAVHE